MQTQYKLLYRYINDTTNVAITDESDYNKTEEFYNSQHELYIDNSDLDKNFTTYTTISDIKVNTNINYGLKYKYEGITSIDYAGTLNQEAEEARETLITENMANEEKSNNLYVYTGTKKSYHTKYVPEQLGYVVRDYTLVPEEQMPTGPDDYSKHFVLVGGSQLGIDDAKLVCKPQYIKQYLLRKFNNKQLCFVALSTDDLTNTGYAHNNTYYQKHIDLSSSDFSDIVNTYCNFEWINTDYTDSLKYCETMVVGTENSTQVNSNGDTILVTKKVISHSSSAPTTATYNYIFFNNDNVTAPISSFTPVTYTPPNQQSDGRTTYYGWMLSEVQGYGYYNFGVNIIIDETNLVTKTIPAHYEDTGLAPYLIRDTYKKIELSPWMLHSISNSLEESLERAKKLVSKIGMNNVKLIKTVPIDQFIKIK